MRALAVAAAALLQAATAGTAGDRDIPASVAALDDLTRAQLQLELLNLHARTDSTILLVTHNIFEAVLLSGRVVVMGEKPGRILGEVKVDLDYPRDLRIMGTPEYGRKVQVDSMS